MNQEFNFAFVQNLSYTRKDKKTGEYITTHDEDLQEKFTNVLNDFLQLLDDPMITSQITYIQARSLVYGKDGETFRTFLNNFDQNTINFTDFVGGVPKNDSINVRFKNTNAFNLKHENGIFNYITQHINGSYNKLLKEIRLLNHRLEINEYQYNKVYYGFYEGW